MWEREGKAALISTSMRAPVFPLIRAVWVAKSMSRMFLVILRPGRKPRWEGWQSWLAAGVRRRLRVEAMIRLSVLITEIGRVFSGVYAGSPLGVEEGFLARRCRMAKLKSCGTGEPCGSIRSAITASKMGRASGRRVLYAKKGIFYAKTGSFLPKRFLYNDLLCRKTGSAVPKQSLLYPKRVL